MHPWKDLKLATRTDLLSVGETQQDTLNFVIEFIFVVPLIVVLLCFIYFYFYTWHVI